MMEVLLMRQGHPLWQKTIEFAQACSWQAGPFLANLMRENRFLDWERVIAAVDDGSVAGFCTVTEKDELADRYPYSPFIGFVFVDERHRGERLSEKMIDCALRYAKELGYPAAYLMSGEQGLYEKYGFVRMGEYETVFGTTDQLFRKPL